MPAVQMIVTMDEQGPVVARHLHVDIEVRFTDVKPDDLCLVGELLDEVPEYHTERRDQLEDLHTRLARMLLTSQVAC